MSDIQRIIPKGSPPAPAPGKIDKSPATPAAPHDTVDISKSGATASQGMLGKVKQWARQNISGEASATAQSRQPGDGDFTTKAAVIGAGVGAPLGGFLGYESGKLEEARAQRSTETWQAPTLEQKHLGNIPQDQYTPKWGWLFGYGVGNDHVQLGSDGQIQGGQPVNRDAPVYNPDGSVKMHPETKTIQSARYGPVVGALGGAFLFGVAGALGGVAVGVIHRLMSQGE